MMIRCLAGGGAVGQGAGLWGWPGVYEPFSAVSHLAGAAVFVVLGVMLVRRGWDGGVGRRVFLLVYAVSCVVMLSASGVYHMMAAGGLGHRVMLRLDHGAIFVMIAGTFTPIHGLLFRGWLRWGVLAVIWGAAVAGIVLKVVYMDAVAEWVGLTLYLTLGWLGVVGGVVLWRRHGFGFIRPMLWGGVAYSVGAAMDFVKAPVVWRGVVHAHEVFHVAVLLGAAFHYAFIWRVAKGEVAGAGPAASGA